MDRTAPLFLLLLLLLAPDPARPLRAGLVLEGVRGEVRQSILAGLSLDDLPCDAPDWRVRRLVRDAPRSARESLEAFGYYQPQIEVNFGRDADCWTARMKVMPGPVVVLRDVNVRVDGEGGSDPEFAKLLRGNPLHPGEPLRHASYEEYKRALVETARQRGYFQATLGDRRIDVYPDTNTADVTLILTTGPRYHFGAVTFEQDVVAPNLVERFVNFRPGEPFDGEKVKDLYNALLGTGYFASIDVATRPGDPPDLAVPVTVRLMGAKRQIYTAGLGYSTDTGPRVRAGYTNRRLNDYGHQLEFATSLSPRLSEGGITYRIPRDDPRVEWLNFDVAYKREDTTSEKSETAKTGVRQFKRLPGDWIETNFVDLGVERYMIAGDTASLFLVIPGVSFGHSEVPKLARPLSGHRVTLTFTASAHAIGSDSQFVQADLFGKVILPMWSGARILLRGEVGATVKEQFRTLPASVRFFAGGDTSVRGYDYQALGPQDSLGNVLGGSHKIVGSVELDQRVLQNWSIAAFLDAGNAFDRFDNLNLKAGAGAGIRWYSPLGPIRVDVAVPLARDAPDAYRIHVTLGPDL